MDLNFRNLNPDEIEVRVGTVAKDKSYITLLLYQNSRVAMDLLDEVVGKNNWQREHTRDNKNCTISIWDEQKQQWVCKEDTGIESNTQQEKGLASDSFKRSAVNWGIGRCLYSAPDIYINGNADQLKYNKYFVKEIGYDDNNKINKLIIQDKNQNIVYTYPKAGGKSQPQKAQATAQPKLISEAQRKRLFAISNGNNDVVKRVLARYKYEKTEQIKMLDYEQICTEIESEILM